MIAEEHIQIRDYTSNDFAQINKLWEATELGGSIRGDNEKIIDNTIKQGGKLFVMEHQPTGQVIGTSWLTQDGRRIYLHHFGINPDFQGNGLSNILLEESLDYAQKRGLQIKLEVHQSNERAIGIYKKTGFQYLGDYNVYIIRDYKTIKQQ